MIKLFVVDDSAIVRQAFKKIADAASGIEYFGSANDPIEAMEKLEKSGDPDVMILDIEMPRMNGLEYLEKIMKKNPLPVIICSGVAEQGSENALKALSMGAIEVVSKPKIGVKDFLEETAAQLIESIEAAYLSKNKLGRTRNLSMQKPLAQGAPRSIDLIAIGLSTGGVGCLEQMIRFLMPSLPPILVVQHMPAGFTKAFADRMDRYSTLQVYEAEDGMVVENNTVYVAPGDRHMTFDRNNGGKKIKLQDGPRVSGHRPSVDVLFRSLVGIPEKMKIAAFLMTGMGRDGASGLLELRQNGAYTAAQDEATSVVYGMPKAAAENGGAQEILSLESVIQKIQLFKTGS